MSCPWAITAGRGTLERGACLREPCPATAFYPRVLFVLEGGTLQGFISDVLQRRAPVLALSLFLAVGSLVGYSREYPFAVALIHLLRVSGQPWGEP